MDMPTSSSRLRGGFIWCHSNDTHQRHCTGCKFTGNAYTHKCFIIRPQLNNNPPTCVIQLAHKHATISFSQKIIKHSFLEITEILQRKINTSSNFLETYIHTVTKLIPSLKLNHLIQTINNHVNNQNQ